MWHPEVQKCSILPTGAQTGFSSSCRFIFLADLVSFWTRVCMECNICFVPKVLLSTSRLQLLLCVLLSLGIPGWFCEAGVLLPWPLLAFPPPACSSQHPLLLPGLVCCWPKHACFRIGTSYPKPPVPCPKTCTHPGLAWLSCGLLEGMQPRKTFLQAFGEGDPLEGLINWVICVHLHHVHMCGIVEIPWMYTHDTK